MPRRVRGVRRTPSQVIWDEAAEGLMREFGRALRDARIGAGLSQTALAARVGVVQGTISWMEQGKTATISLLVLNRAAAACRTGLHVYLDRTSSASEPRDITHLRAQALVVDLATPGGWRSTPKAAIDDASGRSRSIDVLLDRTRPDVGAEAAVIEIHDWFADLGAAQRDWDRRLARVAQRALALRTREGDAGVLVPRVSGCWVVRATQRNRKLVAELRGLFVARFAGSGRDWLAALGSSAPMPSTPALLWISVRGDRIWPARL